MKPVPLRSLALKSRGSTPHPGDLARAVCALLVVGCCYARAQRVDINADHVGGMVRPVAGRPVFEVAVVRPSAPGAEFRFNGIGMPPGRMEITGTTLKDMIEFAYAVPDERQITGGPGWIRTERFDLTAKPGEAEMAALGKMSSPQLHDAMRVRLQGLLEQRFGLQVSFAQKTLPLLVLEQTKSGLRCVKVRADNAAAFENVPPPPPPPERHLAGHEETMHWSAEGLPFPMIVSWISQQPETGGRTVVDRTGLSGGFRCELTWSHDEANPAESSFVTALREQMGLQLRPERGAVEVLVVDGAERPLGD